jgi:predicted 2-oxoglutarate/Fe(II)-dependent dioxygenase YbiX
MYKQYLHNYIKVYNNFLALDFCDSVIDSLNNVNYIKHHYQDYNDYVMPAQKDDLQVTRTIIQEEEELNVAIVAAIETYMHKDMADFAHLWDTCNGFTKVRYNKYFVNTKMHQHIDHIHNIFDGKIKGIPTLSIVGLLNDNYTGGEFIMWDNTVINLTKGSILIFPSTFMFPHRVNEIKSGVRHSFVSWTF